MFWYMWAWLTAPRSYGSASVGEAIVSLLPAILLKRASIYIGAALNNLRCVLRECGIVDGYISCCGSRGNVVGNVGIEGGEALGDNAFDLRVINVAC